MKVFAIILFVLTCFLAISSKPKVDIIECPVYGDTASNYMPGHVFRIVEDMPLYQGGQEAMMKYLQSAFIAPKMLINGYKPQTIY